MNYINSFRLSDFIITLAARDINLSFHNNSSQLFKIKNDSLKPFFEGENCPIHTYKELLKLLYLDSND
jgi:hypothetical protein